MTRTRDNRKSGGVRRSALSILLVLTMLVAALSACGKSTQGPESTSGSGGSSVFSGAGEKAEETGTEPTGEAHPAAEPEEDTEPAPAAENEPEEETPDEQIPEEGQAEAQEGIYLEILTHTFVSERECKNYSDETAPVATSIYDELRLSPEAETRWPALAEALTAWNRGAERNAKASLGRCIRDAENMLSYMEEESYFSPMEVSQTAKLLRMDDALFSVELTDYGYYGGAHPVMGINALIIDPTTGETLEPSRFVTDREGLTEAVCQSLTESEDGTADYMAYEENAQQVRETVLSELEHHTLTILPGADKIQIAFSSYEIGPYVLGMPTVDLTLEEAGTYFDDTLLKGAKPAEDMTVSRELAAVSMAAEDLPESGLYIADLPEWATNNGSYAIGLDNYIFFRGHTVESLERSALWAQFIDQPALTQPDTQHSAAIMAYDINRESTWFVYRDNGVGKLFYGDKGIYTNRYTEGLPEVYFHSLEDDSEMRLCSGAVKDVMQDLSGTALLGIDDEYGSGTVSLWKDQKEVISIKPSEGEELTYLGIVMDTDMLLLMATDYESGQHTIWSASEEFGLLELGTLDIDEELAMGSYPIFQEMIPSSGRDAHCYFSFVYRQGTGMFYAGQEVYSVLPWVEGSLEKVDYTDLRTDESEEGFMELDDNDEMTLVTHRAGSTALSDGWVGDLEFYPDTEEKVVLWKDWIPSEEDRDSVYRSFLQRTEFVNGGIFVCMAYADRDPENDIGWREAYRLKGLDYFFIPYMDPETWDLYEYPPGEYENQYMYSSYSED